MKQIITKTFESPVGELILGSYDQKICLCDWRYRKMRQPIDKRISAFYNSGFEEGTSELIEETVIQLEEYFSGNREMFDIPLAFIGTEFQKQVWSELVSIPYGQTMSYMQLSEKLENSGAIRAVASANGANALSIIVPCHRIIGSDGSLTGYAGGLPAKKKLLQLEKALVVGQIELF